MSAAFSVSLTRLIQQLSATPLRFRRLLCRVEQQIRRRFSIRLARLSSDSSLRLISPLPSSNETQLSPVASGSWQSASAVKTVRSPRSKNSSFPVIGTKRAKAFKNFAAKSLIYAQLRIRSDRYTPRTNESQRCLPIFGIVRGTAPIDGATPHPSGL